MKARRRTRRRCAGRPETALQRAMTVLAPAERLPADPREERVRRVLVVGGGSAGWMAAAALATALSREIAVVLVESEALGTVGVGEATIPPIQQFNRFLKLDERRFLSETQGTFKLGIEFHHWGQVGDAYLHQFGGVGREIDTLVKLHHWWLAGRLTDRGADGGSDGGDYPEWQDLHMARGLARENRFAPPGPARRELANRYTYAYHFDAQLYARHLRAAAEARGVRRVEGRIVGVERATGSGGESGDVVAAVVLADGERLAADLFLDCSGFRSLLLGGALGEPFDDWSRWIPNDRALAAPTARDPGAPLTPYTKGIAHAVGWQWRIPLQHRTGNGHVFASAFSSEAEAEQRLLGCLATAPLAEPRLIRFTTGRRSRASVGNVVAIGLAAGFLEPLESTSLHLVQSALERLIALFPSRRMDAPLRDRFNERTRAEWEDVRDFIIAHYKLTQRRDSEFWRYTAHMEVPDSLAAILELWRARGVLGVDGGHLFQLASWASVLIGQRFLPEGVHALADRAGPDFAAAQVRAIAAEVRAAAAGAPEHAVFVAGYRAAHERAAAVAQPRGRAIR